MEPFLDSFHIPGVGLAGDPVVAISDPRCCRARTCHSASIVSLAQAGLYPSSRNYPNGKFGPSVSEFIYTRAQRVIEGRRVRPKMGHYASRPARPECLHDDLTACNTVPLTLPAISSSAKGGNHKPNTPNPLAPGRSWQCQAGACRYLSGGTVTSATILV
jgi:hypothetical protein